VSNPAEEKPEAIIERMTRELDALRQENKELAEAQQQAAETISSLEAAQQQHSTPMISWHSEVPALTFGIATTSDGSTNGRRSATARPRPREVPRRDDAAPMSLDPQ
jgi:molecular chaperone DnaK (HSP70)